MLFTTALALLLSNAGLTFKAGVLSTPMPVHFSMDFASWGITALTLSLITFLASWLVSRRAAKMVIADALRYVA
jgi:ABC-type antimicrobial peptide transport system permease subunit